MTNHATVKNDVLLAIGRIPGVMVWNNPTGVARPINNPDQIIRFGTPGAPDIMGVAWSQAVAIEIKTGTGRQKEPQKLFQAAFEKAGGVYRICRSVEDALRLLQEIKKKG